MVGQIWRFVFFFHKNYHCQKTITNKEIVIIADYKVIKNINNIATENKIRVKDLTLIFNYLDGSLQVIKFKIPRFIIKLINPIKKCVIR